MYYEIHGQIVSEHMEELKLLPAPLMSAEIFRHFVEEIPLFFRKEDRLAGWYGYEENPENTEYAISLLSGRHPVLSDKERAQVKHLAEDLKTELSFSAGHCCIDYKTVIEQGLISYLNRVEKELSKEPDNAMLQAMKLELLSCERYAQRFAARALEETENAENAEQKGRLLQMYSALLRVPMYPAENFLEAVQAVWIMHTLIPASEMSWASISVGRMDQYLYPFYKKAVEDGTSKEEIKGILKNLLRLLDSYGDGACALNIGGMDATGNDMMNELSELFIEAEKETALRAPILAVRVNPNTPDAILDDLIDFDLFRIGQPTFYNELSCRDAVMGRGIPEQEAAGFVCNSCMGLYLTGKEFADMWGVKFNSHLPLELAVNHGKPFHGELALELKTEPRTVTGLEELLEQYEKYFSELMGICTVLQPKVAAEAEANHPNPLLSVMIEGCLEKRRDRSVAARYQTITVETMGFVNTCDAMEAVCELVFEQKKYTLEELIEAAKNNFETDDVLYHDLRNCKKYGMNDQRTDSICHDLSGKIADICKTYARENLLFLPSLHTIDANVGYGAGMYATLDGRKMGEPVCKNANPSDLVNNLVHTSHILSASAVQQTRFSGGQPIDLYFQKDWFGTKESRDRIKMLVKTYFELGGLQFQVNAVDIELLEKAHKAPEKYPNVVVRKGGYSVFFAELSEKAREEFIEHAKKEDGIGA